MWAFIASLQGGLTKEEEGVQDIGHTGTNRQFGYSLRAELLEGLSLMVVSKK